MRFTEFFWDFDGTLFDTYPRMSRAFVRGLRDFGVRAAPEEALAWMKISLNAAAAHYAPLVPGADKAKLIEAYRSHSEEEPFDTMRPYPGTGKLLRGLVRSGGRNYLFTHRGETALPALEREGLKEYFTDTVTRAMGFPAKPAPDAILYLVDKYGLDRENCVMIGDREIDLKSGAAAGIACALFDADGFERLCDTVPVCTARSMDELAEKLL